MQNTEPDSKQAQAVAGANLGEQWSVAAAFEEVGRPVAPLCADMAGASSAVAHAHH